MKNNKYIPDDETNRPHEGDDFDALGYWLAWVVVAAVVAFGVGYVLRAVAYFVGH